MTEQKKEDFNVNNENTGFLHINTKRTDAIKDGKTKEEVERLPIISGQLNVNGNQMDIALWENVSERTGKTYYSAKLTDKSDKVESPFHKKDIFITDDAQRVQEARDQYTASPF